MVSTSAPPRRAESRGPSWSCTRGFQRRPLPLKRPQRKTTASNPSFRHQFRHPPRQKPRPKPKAKRVPKPNNGVSTDLDLYIPLSPHSDVPFPLTRLVFHLFLGVFANGEMAAKRNSQRQSVIRFIDDPYSADVNEKGGRDFRHHLVSGNVFDPLAETPYNLCTLMEEMIRRVMLKAWCAVCQITQTNPALTRNFDLYERGHMKWELGICRKLHEFGATHWMPNFVVDHVNFIKLAMNGIRWSPEKYVTIMHDALRTDFHRMPELFRDQANFDCVSNIQDGLLELQRKLDPRHIIIITSQFAET